ncbi:TatD family hydrolase [Algoriphagus namhaensis]
MKYIDTHAHIYSRKFESDLDLVMAGVQEAGVDRIYMPNIDLESISAMLAMEKKYPGVCIPMMGLHPCDVKEDFEEQLQEMENWFERRDFAAVGEIGLDLYWDKSFFEQQKEALRIQISWAKKKNLPIILHCRESMEETISLVRAEQDGSLGGIFHCFTGTLAQAQEIIELGFYLGIGGVATFKNGGLDTVIPEIGLERLVLETDAPYLAPVPHRGKRNSPEYIPIIAEKIGDYLGVSKELVAQKTTENALKVFEAYESKL